MTNSTEITKAILIWTPPQQEQYYRPFEANLNGDTLNRILVATDNGSLLTSAAMAPAASGIISPSTIPKEQLMIPGGMSEGRYAFFIEITVDGIFGKRRELITGFTDRDGVNRATGSIDPNMQFHVNSIIEISDYETVGSAGRKINSRVLNSSQVLADRPSQNKVFAMRPEDVVSNGQVSLMMQGGDNSVMDFRNQLNGAALMSDRSNAIPSKYLSTVCQGYINAGNAVAHDFTDNDENMYNEALSNLHSSTVTISAFYTGLGILDALSSHTFTFAQINNAWPRTNEFWSKITPRPGSTLTSPIEYSERWTGANLETSIAFSLTHMMPSLMSRLMLMELELEITNMTLDGRPNCGIINHTPMFDGVVTPQHLQYLQNQMEMEVIKGLLDSITNTFQIRIYVNLLTTSKFDISINGQPAIPYVAPMYCDSYYSPVLGLENNSLNVINESVETLVNHLSPNSFLDPILNNGPVHDFTPSMLPNINTIPMPQDFIK